MSFRESLPWNVIICLTIAACSDSSGPDLRQSLSLQVVSGDSQIDTVARTLPDPIIIRIEDTAGRAVRGQIVNFVVTAGGGSVFAGSAITNEQGQAQEIWTLGTAAGEQELEARAVAGR
jgi:hypothetical protein